MIALPGVFASVNPFASVEPPANVEPPASVEPLATGEPLATDEPLVDANTPSARAAASLPNARPGAAIALDNAPDDAPAPPPREPAAADATDATDVLAAPTARNGDPEPANAAEVTLATAGTATTAGAMFRANRERGPIAFTGALMVVTRPSDARRSSVATRARAAIGSSGWARSVIARCANAAAIGSDGTGAAVSRDGIVIGVAVATTDVVLIGRGAAETVLGRADDAAAVIGAPTVGIDLVSGITGPPGIARAPGTASAPGTAAAPGGPGTKVDDGVTVDANVEDVVIGRLAAGRIGDRAAGTPASVVPGRDGAFPMTRCTASVIERNAGAERVGEDDCARCGAAATALAGPRFHITRWTAEGRSMVDTAGAAKVLGRMVVDDV